MKHASLFQMEEMYSLALNTTEEGRARLQLAKDGSTVESRSERSKIRREACDYYNDLVKEDLAMAERTRPRLYLVR